MRDYWALCETASDAAATVLRFLVFDIIEAKRRWETLTEKEQQVLTLIAAGLLNKEVAERLGNSVRTIENHRAAAMKRLQIKTLAQLHSLIEAVKESTNQ